MALLTLALRIQVPTAVRGTQLPSCPVSCCPESRGIVINGFQNTTDRKSAYCCRSEDAPPVRGMRQYIYCSAKCWLWRPYMICPSFCARNGAVCGIRRTVSNLQYEYDSAETRKMRAQAFADTRSITHPSRTHASGASNLGKSFQKTFAGTSSREAAPPQTLRNQKPTAQNAPSDGETTTLLQSAPVVDWSGSQISTRLASPRAVGVRSSAPHKVDRHAPHLTELTGGPWLD